MFKVPGVLLPTVLPFLDAIKNITPAALPFSQYLATWEEELPSVTVELPRYAREPGFAFDFSPLVGGTKLTLRPTISSSVDAVKKNLAVLSQLDPSQIEAVVNNCTREIALLQGPPGTGKSFVGIETISVLLASGIKPILVCTQSNQAVDHILEELLDKRITSNIIRIGSNSKSDRIRAVRD